MANLAKWNLVSTSPAVTFMSTTIAALASSTLSVISSQTQVNSSQLRIYCDASINVGTTIGPFGTGAFATLYIVPLVDGTNAAEFNQTELEALVSFPLTTSTANAQHRVSRRLITVSPADFQVALFNGTTQAFSTGGGDNTVQLAFYDVNLNG